MLTKNELQEKFDQIIAEAQRDPSKSNELFQSLVTFLMKNSCNLNSEAQESLDHFLSDMNEKLHKDISSMPDSPEKCLIERRFRTQDPRYPSVLKCKIDFGDDRPHSMQLMRDSIAIFDVILQDAIDHLRDVNNNTQSGPAVFAQYSLFIISVNEQLVASHLIQKQYYNQAYTHVRTVMENMDKIKLFSKFPEMAKKWAGDDREKYWREFMPSNVRKALGNPGYDPLYSFFSKLGPHGTFDGVKLISAKKVVENAPRPQLTFWIGNCPREDQAPFALGFLIHTAFSFLELVAKTFSQQIPTELQCICRENAFKSLAAFHEQHMIPSLRKFGFDVDELESWLREVKTVIDSVVANN